VFRYSFDFLRYWLRLRGPLASLTLEEVALLRRTAHGKRCIVEIGCFEGATSAHLCGAMDARGLLYLVDPYPLGVRLEKLLRSSFAEYVARRSLAPWASSVRFVRQTSAVAAEELVLHRPADLIFIDADHRYKAVLQDFLLWGPRLGEDGVIALHDSHPCVARPDLDEHTGPVRLAAEIVLGRLGGWWIAETVDSVSLVRRK
jgi:predicted O-methyltransferase YrrM